MDKLDVTSAVLAVILIANSGLCHVLSYPGHVVGSQFAHLSGAHLGLHRLPLLHLSKVAGPPVLASSSSSLRQVYSEPYYPAPGYPAPGYPAPDYPAYSPGYGEYVPYPAYPQYPEYSQYPGSNQISHFLPDNNQQVPPNVSVSKLPPILEGFVQRIQNLLSHYNPENHNQAAKPGPSFLQNPVKPLVANVGWGPQFVVTPTFTTQLPLSPQGAVSPAVGVAPLHPSVGVTTLQPVHPTLGVTPLRPLPPSFIYTPAQSIPQPIQPKPDQPIATQRPEPAATPANTPSPPTTPSNIPVNNITPDNTPANSGQTPNAFGLFPNRPSFVAVATQTPNNNQDNVKNNNNNNTPINGGNQPGTFTNVPQTTLQPAQQPQGNTNTQGNVNNNPNTQPQQPQPSMNNNNSPSGSGVNNGVPSFSAYGAPDSLPSTLNQVGSQRPPAGVTSTPSVSYMITAVSATSGAQNPSSNGQSASNGNTAFAEYGAPDPFRLPQTGRGHSNGESLQTFGQRSQTNELIALIRQYGISLSPNQGKDVIGGAGNSYSVVPVGSLTAPQSGGGRYNYNQPAKPFRYPSNY